MFIALKGPNFNANLKAEEALSKGALYAVVDEVEVVKDDRYLLVEDALTTMQELARYHRHLLDVPVIGITGSNGKTTTKELIKTVLGTKYQVAFTQGNYNNHIGVPLTILNADKQAEILIVEMGTNQPGDIQQLCDIAQPNFGLITNIGLAHLELLKSQDGVFEEKISLFDTVRKNDGHLFVNSDDEYLAVYESKQEKRSTYRKDRVVDYKLSCQLGVNQQLQYTLEKEGSVSISHNIQLAGKYNRINIASALTVGAYFDIALGDGLSAVAAYVPANQRSQFIRTDRNTIVADAYNANPSSMMASVVSFCEEQKGNNVTLILGDMLELGEQASRFHKDIIGLVESLKVQCFFVGPLFTSVATQKGNCFIDTTELIGDGILSGIRDNSILVKGSRGIRLEQVFKYL